MRDSGMTSVTGQNCKDFNFDYVAFGDYDYGQAATVSTPRPSPKRLLERAQKEPCSDLDFVATFALANQSLNAGSPSAVRRIVIRAARTPR